MKRASYSWLLKWVLAAILIAVGATMFFNDTFVYLTTGIGIVIFSVFRLYPLFKSLNKEILRTLNIVEIVLSVIIGGLMIYVGVVAIQNQNSIGEFWAAFYRYGLAFVFIVRTIVFLYSVVFLEEKTEQIKFWTHLGVFAIGSMLIIYDDFNHEWVAWLLLLISCFGGAYLIYDGTKGYGKYREYSRFIQETKQEKSKEKDKQIDLPAPEDQDRPYVSWFYQIKNYGSSIRGTLFF